jgi:hypothetical protein
MLLYDVVLDLTYSSISLSRTLFSFSLQTLAQPEREGVKIQNLGWSTSVVSHPATVVSPQATIVFFARRGIIVFFAKDICVPFHSF